MYPSVGLFLLVIGIGVFILIYGMRLKAHRDQRLAGLYEKALDKGLDPRQIKFDLEERERGDPYGNLKAGIILLAVALGIFAGIWATDVLHGVYRLVGFALVPAAIGLAVLFIHVAIPRPAPPTD